MISMIAAVARNRAIGFENKLIYWLPNDLKRFKALTTGHTIVMGRKTFESLPKGALPNRRNCVLTRSTEQLPGCECFKDWDSFIASCQPDEDIYIIGGASLYSGLIDKAQRLCLTEIDDTPAQADTFFPDYSEWKETWREDHATDEKHAFAYSFVDYVRS
ncbi:dihydrofolate reductase [uncultured Prevotella sp.]|uniref:dihydrofolate reductase n=1 Tax=uncultured Prevotella sp. TaxID=159272 RepID=UPI0025D49A45|nr:dihydrofolate reductase [uncultured Prevotella sp.]